MSARTWFGGEAIAAAAPRIAWIDIARGIGIVLVVYGHGLRSLYPVQPPATGWPVWQDKLIYSFHMPLFFVLSGLFIARGLARGPGPFTRNKLITIAYPYLLWSLVSGLAELAAAPWVNTPISPMDVALIPIRPIEQYWFLYVLFIDQMIICALYPRRWLLVTAGLAGLLVGLSLGEANIFTRALSELPYLMIGLMARDAFLRAADWPVGRQVAVAVFAWLSLALYLLIEPSGIAGWAGHYGAALAGTVGTMMLAMLIARCGFGATLARLGLASMAIYVMHTLASAGLRVLLMHGIGIRDPMTLLVLSTLAGLAVPLAICRWAQRRGLSTLLGLDHPAGRRSTPPPLPTTN